MEKNVVSQNGKSTSSIIPPKRRVQSLLPKRNRRTVERVKAGVDRPFLLLVILLLCIGTTFVFSASYVYAKANYNDSYFFAKKQIVWAVISLLVMYAVSNVDYMILKRFAWPFFGASYVLLWFVFFFGADAYGAQRWIYFGPVSVQPSEIMKLAVILISARYIVGLGQDKIRSIRYGVIPFGLLVLLIGVPLYLQPHLSAMVIIFALIFCIMYLGGVKGSILGTGLFGGAGAMLAIILLTSHGKSRIDNWLHPEMDILGKGWQPLQSLYAIGSGGLWGTGLGQSKQKHLYLPEPQNDYIFAIVCEEMGLVFALAVILLFLLLIWRGFYIARNAPSKFSSLLAMGIIIQIALQVFLNIAVVTNTFPSTGVSLPFFSYGGSSLTIFMAEMGIVLNISKYSYIEKS